MKPILYFIDKSWAPSQNRGRIWKERLVQLGATVTESPETATHAIVGRTRHVPAPIAALTPHLRLVGAPAINDVLRERCLDALEREAHHIVVDVTGGVPANFALDAPESKPRADPDASGSDRATPVPGTDEQQEATRVKRSPASHSSSLSGAAPPLKRRNALAAEMHGGLQVPHAATASSSSLAYRRAAMALRAIPFEVQSLDQLTNLPLLNRAAHEAVQWVLDHGTLAGFPRLYHESDLDALRDLRRLWGVGVRLAWQFLQHGWRSAEAVVKAVHEGKLKPANAQLEACCRDWTDLCLPIPRERIDALRVWILGLVQAADPGARVTVTGGYRRGNSECHDVDLIIAASAMAPGALLQRVLADVRQAGCLVYAQDGAGPAAAEAHQSLQRKLSSRALPLQRSHSTFDDLPRALCIICEPETKTKRRVDLVLCAAAQEPFAVLGWTGNRMYNREIRRWADAHGFHLTAAGLWDLEQGGVFVPAESPTAIQRLLGLPTLSPEQRHH
ncbi:uncharacterized protein MONBRDRAFT_7518 [Monosiga brevicollis MX1]|uniref:DNA-directed DNA polymerase X domain-containing protein n=1 Tax=Monosiga brevicollis TaxID=81824 RepID=A9UX82_MONBE|nr:uncharacterized protein MONBRDRAFT_7518 [Monosiga brevicollis MX1]EDQ90173.1 predicted protein [Monosiga brevicollis MX1]|eukprot:XP_001744940.1 hypothetical protein [Monosiga brevicollis MX1]